MNEEKIKDEIQEEKLYCRFDRELFRNAQSGYCIFVVTPFKREEYAKTDPNFKGYFVCSAVIPSYTEGTPLFVEGRFETNSHGRLLVLTNWKVEGWDQASLATYLDGLVQGIGQKTAAAIANLHPDIIGFFRDENSVDILVREIQHMKPETAASLREAVLRTTLEKEVYEMLAPAGGDWAQTLRIVTRFGSSCMQAIYEDVFNVGNECKIPFAVCDALAKTSGMDATSGSRIRAILLKAMEQEKSVGNTFTSVERMRTLVHKICAQSPFNEPVPTNIFTKALDDDKRTFVFEYDKEGEEAVYLRSMYNAEKNVAEQLHRLNMTAKKLNFRPSVIAEIENEFGMSYAEQQRNAFYMLTDTAPKILTGGPGTGKTTVVRGMIEALERLNPGIEIKLCAPTGRAAQRMAESTGKEATTIHRLLEYKPFGANGEMKHKDAEDQIEAGAIIVDETSMFDIELASIFLTAVPDGTMVLFVGDINQLPSVGPGNVLDDIIKSQIAKTTRLTAVYRQGADSLIIRNANRINQGIMPSELGKDFKGFYQCQQDELKDAVIQETLAYWNPKEPFETQVLLPTHKGDAGVAAINAELQSILNPQQSGKPEIRYGKKVFRLGDKVVLLSNNYEVGYYNGDLGIITKVNKESLTIRIGNEEFELDRTLFDDVNHAYAMTIHKSQGSEFKHCVIGLPMNPSNMLQRNLLYTAVTRAKKVAVVIGEVGAVQRAVNANNTAKRRSRLVERIRMSV